jgi:tetratricopeptide (TPR) repeat protein
MRTKAGIIGILFSLTLFAGCPKPVTKPPAHLVDQYISKAQEFEAKGDLVAALEQYKFLLTVDPQNQLSKEKTYQIEAALIELAEKHYQMGITLHRKGEYSRARQEFLTTLRYSPEHPEANKMLKEHELEEQQVKGYLLHTIQADESISILAQKYYGDNKKFQIIAEYNRMEDATKVKVGQEIRVPVVHGMPFFGKPEEIITISGDISATSLTEVVPVKNFILHTVQPDESLSKLALRYYGDYKKFPIIAHYNQLDENAGLRVGQEIRIPEIEGVSFTAKQTKEDVRAAEMPPTTTAVKEPPKEKKEEIKLVTPDDQLVNYRELGIELYNEKNYAAAINEFNKVLNLNPEDKAALEYLSLAYFEQGKSSFEKEEYKQAIEEFETALRYNEKCSDCQDYIKKSQERSSRASIRSRAVALFKEKNFEEAIGEFEKVIKLNPNDSEALEYISFSHFQQGLVLFGKENYLTARDEFKASLQYNKECEKCEEYIQKSEETYKDAHYSRALMCFRDEKLADAVQEWELVYEIDPNYKDVDSNLKKARKLLERLESIKRSRMKGE